MLFQLVVRVVSKLVQGSLEKITSLSVSHIRKTAKQTHIKIFSFYLRKTSRNRSSHCRDTEKRKGKYFHSADANVIYLMWEYLGLLSPAVRYIYWKLCLNTRPASVVPAVHQLKRPDPDLNDGLVISPSAQLRGTIP